MRLGQVEKYKGEGLVAFLDILGFSKEIVSNWDNKELNPLDKILKLKEQIDSFMKAERKIMTNNSESFRRYECRVQTISDSLLISFGFEEKPHDSDFIIGTIQFLATISFIWRIVINAGYTIRGAADFGKIYWDEKEIIGPAFINAYQAELYNAKTSRVIVTSNFNKYLANKYSEVKTAWNDEILKHLRKDIDGYLIINPHLLYKGIEDKNRIIALLTKLQNDAIGTQKEKYVPLLACLNTEDKLLESFEMGLY